MRIERSIPGGWEAVPYGGTIVAGGARHPWQITELWSDAELAAIGLRRVSDPAPPLLDYLSHRRWEIETGGITVGGRLVRTDRESQGLITGAYQLALAEPDEPVTFKLPAGFVTLSSAEMQAIAVAVARHVRACFAAEAELAAAIESGDITTTAEIDTALEEALSS